MSQDNIFENREWQPSGNDGKFDDLIVRDAKRSFSRFFLAIFVFLLVANVAVLITTNVMTLVMGLEEYQAFVESSPFFELLLSSVSLYLIALPVLYLIVKPIKTRKREKRKLPLLELFHAFLVAEAFMIVGNLLGQSVTTSISSFFGIEINDLTSDIILKAPIWLIFVLVVVVGPLVEEFIFRKLMIDKLSRFGDSSAIIVSAIAFGLFHGNFYQFFYATLLGLLLGYVYAKSGKLIYTAVLHGIINFIGSIVTIPLLKYQEILLSGAMPETGAELRESFIATMAIGSYSVLEYAAVISGIVIFINAIRYRTINVNRTAELKIPEGKTAGSVIFNTGAILYIVFSLFTFALSILLG